MTSQQAWARAHGLLVLKPDAVQQGLELAIVPFLRRLGFQVEMTTWRRISDETRRELYLPHLMPWSTNWALGGGLYGLGPVRVMLLRHDRVPPGYDSASDFLSRGLKGHHDPLVAAPGTIRGRYNSVNRALNLVHASDTSESLLRELCLLIDSDDGADSRPRPGWGPRALDFPAAIVRVHERLLVEQPRDAGLRDAAGHVVSATRTRLRAAGGRRRTHSILAATLDGLRHLAATGDDERGRLAFELSDRAGFADLDYESVFSRLADAGLRLDPWTEYVLRTSLFYFEPGVRRVGSPERGPAVDDEHLARHEVAVRRQQVHEGAFQVFRDLVPVQGPGAAAAVNGLVVPGAERLGEGESRSERVDGDAVGAQLPGQRAGQGEHRALGGDVVRHAGRRGQDDPGADVHDLAAAAPAEVRDGGLAQNERPADVDGQHPVELVHRDLLEASAGERREQRGVVHQGIHAAQP
jgi:nucleoside diphosphate kinase